MNASMDTQTVTLITVIAGLIYQAWTLTRTERAQREREVRQHQWDVDERLATAVTLANHTTQTAVTLAEHTVTAAATVAEALAVKTTATTEQLTTAIADNTTLTAATTEKLEGLIAENTKISTDAFHEANTVNQKLEKLGADHNALDRIHLADDRPSRRRTGRQR